MIVLLFKKFYRENNILSSQSITTYLHILTLMLSRISQVHFKNVERFSVSLAAELEHLYRSIFFLFFSPTLRNDSYINTRASTINHI